MSKVSRRGILQGLVAGALVLGFDPAKRSWISEARADVPFAHIPTLDGMLTTDPEMLAEVSDDWGHMVHRTPVAVLHAASVDDVVKMVNYCRAHGIKIATRGRGHTAFGQSQAAGGLVIDLRALNEIHSIQNCRAVVDAGVVWRDLLEATVEEGLTPPVLTDYINLTVGGTLSVGGAGGSSFLYGAQVDNVEELVVVTGTGQVVTCSRNKKRSLFEAALAGLGLCAIIVRVTLTLIEAEERAQTYKLFYPDVPSMLADIRVLIADERFDYVRGNGQPGADGWTWYIEATSFYTPSNNHCGGHGNGHGGGNGNGHGNGDPLAGLHFIPGATQIEDRTYFDYCDLTVQIFNMLGQLGLLGLPHPWLDLFVRDSVIDSFASNAVDDLDPSILLPGSLILFFPFIKKEVRQPLFRVPNEKVFFLFDILPTVPPDPNVINFTLQQNRATFERNRALGGTHYTISAVNLSQADWKAHFGSQWPALCDAKASYDPANILGAGVNVFS
ncbi:putative cytokinin oxidase [Minicystis rosea]|nr:putative cytokinin oxidase [Minicystis rosea]